MFPKLSDNLTKWESNTLTHAELKRLCYGRGKEIADYLGIHRSTLSAKINGRMPLRENELDMIAEYLARFHGVNMDDMYFYEQGLARH